MHEEVAPLTSRFLAGLRETLPLTALWVHGSLALGDFQPGRSDLDLIAVVESAPGEAEERGLARLHEELAERFPLAEKLHCSYMVRDRLADPGLDHLTWAHQELFRRPVTEVTRRELHNGDLALHGPAPSALLPAVSDAELAAFVRADLRDYWLPATAARKRWLQDIWVDHGLLTLARARTTLADGRLLTKGQALDALAGLGAPADLLAGIRARRYGTPVPLSLPGRIRRGRRARAFLRAAIAQTLEGTPGA
ncbi:Nucleotidyltransferase domain-containing protein [Actinacidiphila yanglinensis]|uniref:Nucleotidyltransferase domain-containing protein n=1 Tax=Actinacidiphila yanglinensis TaxID=310779 RepID=A0A1H6A847_9ACTN|nr:nucleotidyltransferase domain-containing protein [Actinacidiphila yanglinensis]SEG44621.1 Nucleotidyltransferase domain-containing protein [Actinacidiphila yanglinensis]